jgi:hypothetical protein
MLLSLPPIKFSTEQQKLNMDDHCVLRNYRYTYTLRNLPCNTVYILEVKYILKLFHVPGSSLYTGTSMNPYEYVDSISPIVHTGISQMSCKRQIPVLLVVPSTSYIC